MLTPLKDTSTIQKTSKSTIMKQKQILPLFQFM